MKGLFRKIRDNIDTIGAVTSWVLIAVLSFSAILDVIGSIAIYITDDNLVIFNSMFLKLLLIMLLKSELGYKKRIDNEREDYNNLVGKHNELLRENKKVKALLFDIIEKSKKN